MKPNEVKLVLIHGYNIRDGGESTTGRLHDWAVEYGFTDIVEFKYGYFDLWKVRWNSKKKARELANLIGDKNTVVICHSHGNVIADMAATEFNAPIIYHIGINPALSVNADFAPQVRKVDIYHTPGDRVVTVGKWWKWITTPIAFFKPNYWGEAGRYGVNITKENENQVSKFDMSDHPAGLPTINDHSEFFRYRNLRAWAPELFNLALYKLEKMRPISDVELKAKLHAMTVRLGEKAASDGYIMNFADFRNGREVKYNIYSGSEKITSPRELVKYWVDVLGGKYSDGYFTV